MPELPEVETTRRGIAPHLTGHRITAITVRNRQLRWPISDHLIATLPGEVIHAVERRGKYLLLRCDHGTLLLHLGMSGSLRLVSDTTPAGRHDPVDLQLDSGQRLRLTDPRRFGSLLWCEGDLADHPRLAHLGPEPLGEAFSGDHLYQQAAGRRVAVKNLIMDGHVVVGVGNIYANEALFCAGIDPRRAANRISRDRYQRLAEAIRQVLQRAIDAGGTTLRDFVGGDGKPGYFRQQLQVYGRGGEPCERCGSALQVERIGQRSSVYCRRCQH